ncbi:MAG: hypothetical protein RI949_3157 [Pseudomonadota bacterium]
MAGSENSTTQGFPDPLGAVDPCDVRDVYAMQADLAAGRWSSEQWVRHCLLRIDAMDRPQGPGRPGLGSVMELNPDALALARQCDQERAGQEGMNRLGPLHGVPVLLKDNIATADAMATTAGSLALEGLKAHGEAPLVRRLRAAGAVILGKTNLSEWANFRSTRSTSGWSSRGGQTRNPHVLSRSPSGSSSGSAVAVAAGLCALAVGTETDGSITSPANLCGVVGLKPTLGMVSRSGIIPIAASQDTAGPMTRHVRDAAVLLQAMAAEDPDDPATHGLGARAELLRRLTDLHADALQGARLGVIRSALPMQPFVCEQFERALQVLRSQGAVVVEGLELPQRSLYGPWEITLMLHEFKEGLNRYLQVWQPDAPVRNLGELVDWNVRNARRVMPFFGQELFERAQATQGLQAPEYLEAVQALHRAVRQEGLDALFAQHRLDAVVAPSGSLAWPIDPLLGDHYGGGGISSPFAVAGYPHITVPMGVVAGLPCGLSFGALAWHDDRVLNLAYAWEQATAARVPPRALQGLDSQEWGT